MKQNQRACLREYNNSPFIKFPIKDNAITTTAQKVSILTQAQLGGIEHPDGKDFGRLRRQFNTETIIIFERIQRLIRCVVDCKALDCDAIATRHALDLARSFSAEFWENSNLQMRQIPQVGPVAVRKLVGNGIKSAKQLASLDSATIERYMSKNPPFGKKMLDSLSGFPQLTLSSSITGKAAIKHGQRPKVNVKVLLGFTNARIPVWNGRRPSLTFMAETSDGTLVHFWRGNVQKLEKGYEMKFMVELSSSEDSIKCWIACDDIVGTQQSNVLKHGVPASEFPPPPSIKVDTQEKPAACGGFLSDDEFGDDVGDEDLLAAATIVETGEAGGGYDSDTFADIDDFDHKPQISIARVAKGVPGMESYRMANGKWACNHPCRDGNLLKSGKTCKHRCCHEGLDKPIKLKRKVSYRPSFRESLF